jgi:hypothetical protein
MKRKAMEYLRGLHFIYAIAAYQQRGYDAFGSPMDRIISAKYDGRLAIV